MRAPALLALLLCFALPATAEYQFQPLGTFGNLRSEPSAIDDWGRISGLLTGA